MDCCADTTLPQGVAVLERTVVRLAGGCGAALDDAKGVLDADRGGNCCCDNVAEGEENVGCLVFWLCCRCRIFSLGSSFSFNTSPNSKPREGCFFFFFFLLLLMLLECLLGGEWYDGFGRLLLL